MWMRRVSAMDVSVLVRCWNANSIRCRGTDAGGHWANHPRPDGEVIPTPDSASSADPSETHPSAANGGRAWPTGQGRLAQATCVPPVVPSARGPAVTVEALRFAPVATGGHHVPKPGGDERCVRDAVGKKVRHVRDPSSDRWR